jgi:hypothetical protein
LECARVLASLFGRRDNAFHLDKRALDRDSIMP